MWVTIGPGRGVVPSAGTVQPNKTMAWNVSARGTKTQCIAAVNAMPAGTDGNANNQLARFKSAIITEINAVPGPSVSVVGYGDFSAGTSAAHISVQTVPGVFNQQIASTPIDTV